MLKRILSWITARPQDDPPPASDPICWRCRYPDASARWDDGERMALCNLCWASMRVPESGRNYVPKTENPR